MNAKDLETLIQSFLDSLHYGEEVTTAECAESNGIVPESIRRTRTYEDAMVMTRDNGLVVTTSDGEFQITIVKSR